jgi:hypothetical protein
VATFYWLHSIACASIVIMSTTIRCMYVQYAKAIVKITPGAQSVPCLSKLMRREGVEPLSICESSNGFAFASVMA